MDICNLFNTTIPNLLLEHPEKANTIKGTYLVKIEGAGEWFLDPVSDPPTCTPGTHDADATISISSDNFQKLAADPKGQVFSMLLWGSLKITGNKGLAMANGMKLGELFGSK
jgi:hypothetical protein